MAVALRRPESIALSLEFAHSVLRRLCGNADQQFVRNPLVGLDYLIAETEYRETARTAARYRYEEVPDIRWRAARLAKCLSDLGYGANPVIRTWLEAVAVDPLPDLRQVVSESETDSGE